MTTAFEARFGDDFLDFVKECAESAISDHDFADDVESAWEDMDIHDAVRDAVANVFDMGDMINEWQGSRSYRQFVESVGDEVDLRGIEAEVTALKAQVATLVTMLGTWASDNGYTKPVVADDTQESIQF
jgi:hypothetical protein